MSLRKKVAVKYIRTKFKLLSAISKRKTAEQAFQLFCTPQIRQKKELPEIFKQAERLQFQFQGNTMLGYRWNPSSKKILILHGFESSVIYFDRYVKPLMQKGYEVLAFDAPAHGRSAGKNINAVVYKEFIEAVMQQYGAITSFIAHSFGGIALCLALEECNHDESYKVALIAPATETATSIDLYFNFLKLDTEVRKEFDKLIEELSKHPPEWFSIRRAAAHIKAQVLWVHDEDDDLTPLADAKKVQEKQYPNFQFMITKGLGHRRIYRDSRILKTVLDFL